MKKDSVPEEFDGRKYQDLVKNACFVRWTRQAFFQNMYDYIARIPADDKAPEEEYERRLSICKECEKLLSGMCRMCGATWRCGQRLHCGTARGKSG